MPADEFFGDARAEIHDFRTSQWYVSAATSPKDIVILLDASSAVSSTKRALALLTARTILETLGDNDFVNVFRFADTAAEIVPCFKDMLVQVGGPRRARHVPVVDAFRPAVYNNARCSACRRPRPTSASSRPASEACVRRGRRTPPRRWSPPSTCSTG